MNDYAISVRRELHEHPEIGFELPNTLALLRRELGKLPVAYRDCGKSSIVATLDTGKPGKTVAIRADMDALPIYEKNDVPYRSKNDGKMHACGHDVHTAIALTTLKELCDMRDSLSGSVKIIFQAAEEGLCGASYAAADGWMDGVDNIVALHVSADYPVGTVAMRDGPQDASTNRLTVIFKGKSAHAANQDKGTDAILMGVKFYTAAEIMIAKEIGSTDSVVFHVGEFNGGTSANVISDRCELKCTVRAWNTDTEKFVFERLEAIAKGVAEMSRGEYEWHHTSHYPLVDNDTAVTEALRKAAEKAIGKENVLYRKNRGMIGEDFSYYLQKAPGAMFRLGIANPEKGITSAIHTDTFDVDENCLDVGVRVFKQYVIDRLSL